MATETLVRREGLRSWEMRDLEVVLELAVSKGTDRFWLALRGAIEEELLRRDEEAAAALKEREEEAALLAHFA